MTLDEAIDCNKELRGELLSEGRLRKAKAVLLAIEGLKLIKHLRSDSYIKRVGPLIGETEE